jgi:hypothetical protein
MRVAKFALESILVYHAGVPGGDFALPVDEQCDRHTRYAVAFRQVLTADYHRIVHLLLFDERLDDFPALIVHGDADHHEPALPVLPAKFHVPGDLGFAPVTPGCPEIQ